MIELTEKHIKTVIILIWHMRRKVEERLFMLSRNMKDVIRPKSSFKTWKATMSEMTNTLGGNINRLDTADKKNNELFVRNSIIQIKTRKE